MRSSASQSVTILGTVGETYMGDRGPTRVMLSRPRGPYFSIIFFDKDLFATTRLGEQTGEFLPFRGFFTEHTTKHTGPARRRTVFDQPSSF